MATPTNNDTSKLCIARPVGAGVAKGGATNDELNGSGGDVAIDPSLSSSEASFSITTDPLSRAPIQLSPLQSILPFVSHPGFVNASQISSSDASADAPSNSDSQSAALGSSKNWCTPVINSAIKAWNASSSCWGDNSSINSADCSWKSCKSVSRSALSCAFSRNLSKKCLMSSVEGKVPTPDSLVASDSDSGAGSGAGEADEMDLSAVDTALARRTTTQPSATSSTRIRMLRPTWGRGAHSIAGGFRPKTRQPISANQVTGAISFHIKAVD